MKSSRSLRINMAKLLKFSIFLMLFYFQIQMLPMAQQQIAKYSSHLGKMITEQNLSNLEINDNLEFCPKISIYEDLKSFQ